MPHLPVCPTEVGGPVVHQAAPALEEITARVGRLGGVLYRMGECGFDLCLLFIHPRAPNLISLRSAGTMPA